MFHMTIYTIFNVQDPELSRNQFLVDTLALNVAIPSKEKIVSC